MGYDRNTAYAQHSSVNILLGLKKDDQGMGIFFIFSLQHHVHVQNSSGAQPVLFSLITETYSKK
jgi:hypothetical protein